MWFVTETNRQLEEAAARSRRESEAAIRYAREQRERSAIPQDFTAAPAQQETSSRKKQPGLLHSFILKFRRSRREAR